MGLRKESKTGKVCLTSMSTANGRWTSRGWPLAKFIAGQMDRRHHVRGLGEWREGACRCDIKPMVNSP
jgi:hypothetical protein